jgi:serine/threonine-protein kinase
VSSLTGAFVLPPDVVLTPVAELPGDVRRQFEAEDGDVAITRPRSREPSKVVDAHTAALLGEFREPKTVVDAVISYSRAHRLDPEQTLEQAFPILDRFVRARLLVPPGSEGAAAIVPLHAVGTRVASFEVLQPIQVVDDSELYRVRDAEGQVAALKIGRPGQPPEFARLLAWEAAVLRRLDGAVNPAVVAHGEADGCPYLATSWCDGVPATTVAHRIRREHGLGEEGRTRLRGVAAAVLDAYARIHAQRLIHGDVHPRNVLVDPRGRVMLIDFALARFEGEEGPPGRGGVAFFFEPEFAAARLRGRHVPPATFAGEQYALAALIYLLVAGTHYLEFSAEKREMLRQIAHDPPRAFADPAVTWPELEAVLQRALRKIPSERFESVAGFARAVRSTPAAVAAPIVTVAPSPFDRDAACALVAQVVARLAVDGPLFRTGPAAPPFCSVNYGMAGIACAAYRLASLREDPHLLAAADLWATRAAGGMERDDAFYNPAIEITEATVGRTALYHSATGVHLVQAMVGHAMGDLVSVQSAFDDFVGAFRAHGPGANLDLTLGRSGVLLGCALLADLPARAEWLNPEPVRRLGDEVMGGIWSEVDAMGPIDERASLRSLGIAHGWAGILYATLRWCEVTGREASAPAKAPLLEKSVTQANSPAKPASLEMRLRELAARAEPAGRGLRWPVRLRRARQPDDYATSWCNGSAGHVFLWTLAHRLLGDPIYATLAERAAWDVWDTAVDFDSLCCGLAGAAYALLALHRHTGDPAWLARAGHLGNRAVAWTHASEMPDSLYKGTLGVAVLAADLLDPRDASMPLFEAERWRE